jgi:hypothetical protein
MLIYLTIGIFIFILLSMYFNINLIEGLENYDDYSNCEKSDPTILSQKNTANIMYLKERMDELTKLNGRVSNLEDSVDEINAKLADYNAQQTQYNDELDKTPPADIQDQEEEQQQ